MPWSRWWRRWIALIVFLLLGTVCVSQSARPSATVVVPSATATDTAPPPTSTWTWTPSPIWTPSPTLPPTVTLTPTVTMPPTYAYAPPIFKQGQVDLTAGTNFNFDDGQMDVEVTPGPGVMHVGVRVFFYGPLYFWPPNIADCYNAPYDSKRNAVADAGRWVGLSFCYTTNEGRVGALHIERVYTGADGRPHLVFTYLTWAAKRPSNP